MCDIISRQKLVIQKFLDMLATYESVIKDLVLCYRCFSCAWFAIRFLCKTFDRRLRDARGLFGRVCFTRLIRLDCFHTNQYQPVLFFVLFFTLRSQYRNNDSQN